MSENCLFCKIIAGTIPSTKIYEDDEVIAFNDIHPLAPVHFLIVPKLHVQSLAQCEEQHKNLLGKILLLAPNLALGQGLKGFRTMINTGAEGGQEVFHLHVHLFGGSAHLPKT